MTMLASVSDNPFGYVGPMGARGAIMITPSYFTNPAIPGKNPIAEVVAKREAPTRRGTAPADHLMYAWSMSAGSDAVRTTEHIEIRATQQEECPPEVYLG